jgi:hypothetical protein
MKNKKHIKKDEALLIYPNGASTKIKLSTKRTIFKHFTELLDKLA